MFLAALRSDPAVLAAMAEAIYLGFLDAVDRNVITGLYTDGDARYIAESALSQLLGAGSAAEGAE